MKKNNIYIYALQDKVVFPYHEYTFSINSNVYNPQLHDNLIGFVTKISESNKDVRGIEKVENHSKFGTLLKIHKSDISGGYKVYQRTKVYSVTYYGLTFARFKIISLNKSTDGKMTASIEIFTDDLTKDIQLNLEKKNLVANFKKQLKIYYQCKLKTIDSEIKKQSIDVQTSLNKMLYKAVDEVDIALIEKLKFLQIQKHETRFEFLLNFLTEKTENLKSVIGIEDKVRQDMYKSSNNSITRLMNRKIGQSSRNSAMGDLQAKINAKKLPEHVKEQIDKEMKRMGGEAQSAVSAKYIETLLEIPWLESTQEVKDITAAEKILQQDHTGLVEVKERILEFLAVKFRNGNSKGNIICLHGPPGVGKTSIAKSIARALGKQFTRISLGGMNDEAQLRGHRRTYVAALPGMIVRALMKAKSNNPVILLDEIQKIGKSHKGDPEHALLEILDPSQNSSFVDHYVTIPIDLSKVMFICTANSLQLSNPLLNRLQLIEIPGYTREEKLEIAKNHLIPIQIKQNGVDGLVEFSEDGIVEVIKYSSELGVRELERKLSKICRKVARKGEKQKITKQKVTDILGGRHKAELWSGVGVVNGMAWTQMGGKVLTVEAIQYKSSRQKVEVTGQLGEVMKESVGIALSWIKSNIDELNLRDHTYHNLTLTEKVEWIDKVSLHLHFPEGAIKKDGPSAGVTIITCIASLLLKIPVKANLSMTGEITLSGKVLPVGGIREKCIAAIYQGMKHIIIPAANLKDLEKIPSELKKDVQFYPVKEIKEVLEIALPGVLDKAVAKI